MPSILQGGGKAKAAAPAKADEHMPMNDGGGDGETRSTLVSHADGSHHIEHEDGSTSDHPHIGHALMHLAGKHSDGKHFHTHSDGMGGSHTTHTSEHGGEPEGHDHKNLEEVKEGLSKFFDEEKAEDSDWGEEGHEGGGEGSKDYD